MRQHRLWLTLFIGAALVACASAGHVVASGPPTSSAAANDGSFNDVDRARQAINRLTFGARPRDLAAVERMGVTAWLDLQLHPERTPDPVADSVLGLLDITNKTAFELAADHPQANEFGEAIRQMSQIAMLGPLRASAARELGPSILIRAVASDRQLLEVMTSFWENHFSVSADKMPNPFALVDYDRMIRTHALGVDGGYSQRDVQEVARCLTGWGIDNVIMGGSFAFQPATHDAGEKVVLGVHIAGGRGIEDGQEVLDTLARHPSTAHFIARKLVIRFVSDSASPALVERVAQTYLRTDGDIREILRTIVASAEFNSRAAYRAKVKTPFELVASILRVMNGHHTAQRSGRREARPADLWAYHA